MIVDDGSNLIIPPVLISPILMSGETMRQREEPEMLPGEVIVSHIAFMEVSSDKPVPQETL